MMHDWGQGWFGGWMWLYPLVGFAIAAGVVWLFVSVLKSSAAGRSRDAEAILKERYARGEIDETEYRRRLDELRK